MKNLFLGIDIGTSSTKSLLVDEMGRVIGSAQEEYDVRKPRPVFAEQDPEQLWSAVEKTLRQLSGHFPVEMGRLAGISFSGQMHGLVAVDGEGTPVYPAIIWADQRSGETIQSIYDRIPAEHYHAITLNRISTGFLVSSLVWLKDHEPAAYERIQRVMLPKDYIRFRITGEYGTDVSDASATGIFDTANRTWAAGLIRELGLEERHFVPCHESVDKAGEVTAECQMCTGIPAGTPVFYGGGDTIVQAVGNSAVRPGLVIANIGTASQLVTTVNCPVCDREYRTNTFCHAMAGKWIVMGANLSGGIALKWLRDKILKEESYERMTALAAGVPAGSRGLFFLPYLGGERTPWNDPEAKGIYVGLNLTHGRGELIRSTMEGIIMNQRLSMELFEEMGIPAKRIVASGGGARSPLFRKIMASMFECEVVTVSVQEQACMGAAITAAVGSGFYQSYEEAVGVMVHWASEVTEPDQEDAKRYRDAYAVFKEIYPANRALFDTITKLG